MSREQLGRREDVIDRRLGEVQRGVQTDLQRLTDLVGQLGQATAERFGQVDRSLHVHAEITSVLADTTQQPARGVGQLQRPRPVGRADGRGRAPPGRLRVGVNYVRAHRRGRRGSAASPTSRSCCPRVTCCSWTSSSRWRLPALPRGRHGGRALGAPRHVRARRACPGPRAGQAGVQQGRRATGGGQRAAVRAQRDAGRVHPRERRRAGRRGDAPAGRHLLAAHAVRVPRRHPPGVRQLRHRADEPGDPAICSARSAGSGASTPTRSTRSAASSTRCRVRSTSWPPRGGEHSNGPWWRSTSCAASILALGSRAVRRRGGLGGRRPRARRMTAARLGRK